MQSKTNPNTILQTVLQFHTLCLQMYPLSAHIHENYLIKSIFSKNSNLFFIIIVYHTLYVHLFNLYCNK